VWYLLSERKGSFAQIFPTLPTTLAAAINVRAHINNKQSKADMVQGIERLLESWSAPRSLDSA
jgi:hypothetical protein